MAGNEKQLAPNDWHVMRDTDVGTMTWHPWLTEVHAMRLAELLNEIETERVARLNGNRERGDGDFYTAVKDKGATTRRAKRQLKA
jgi:hypothetical protein